MVEPSTISTITELGTLLIDLHSIDDDIKRVDFNNQFVDHHKLFNETKLIFITSRFLRVDSTLGYDKFSHRSFTA